MTSRQFKRVALGTDVIFWISDVFMTSFHLTNNGWTITIVCPYCRQQPNHGIHYVSGRITSRTQYQSEAGWTARVATGRVWTGWAAGFVSMAISGLAGQCVNTIPVPPPAPMKPKNMALASCSKSVGFVLWVLTHAYDKQEVGKPQTNCSTTLSKGTKLCSWRWKAWWTAEGLGFHSWHLKHRFFHWYSGWSGESVGDRKVCGWDGWARVVGLWCCGKRYKLCWCRRQEKTEKV